MMQPAAPVTAICPHCKHLTYVPSDAENPCCPYCGTRFSLDASVAELQPNEDPLTDIPDGFVVEGGRLTAYHAPQSDVTVSPGVVSIGRECFADLSVRRVVLPEGLDEIKPRAFAGCRQLIEVVLPSSLTEIGDEAFLGCRSLRSVTFPDALRIVGRRAFAGCSSLASVAVTFRHIPAGCFSDCTSLSSLILPDTLCSIAPDAFRRCVSLGGVTIPSRGGTGRRDDGGNGVFSYPGEDISYDTHGVFSGCRSLLSVTCEGLTRDIIRKNFFGTPFLGKWKALQDEVSAMRDTKVKSKVAESGGGAGSGVASTIGTVVASTVSTVIEATPLRGSGEADGKDGGKAGKQDDSPSATGLGGTRDAL